MGEWLQCGITSRAGGCSRALYEFLVEIQAARSGVKKDCFEEFVLFVRVPARAEIERHGGERRHEEQVDEAQVVSRQPKGLQLWEEGRPLVVGAEHFEDGNVDRMSHALPSQCTSVIEPEVPSA